MTKPRRNRLKLLNGGAPTEINNDNIRELVKQYIHDKTQLPENLNIPIGEWDVSKVTDMSYLFESEENFNEPIGTWNVSNVKDMQGMFLEAASFDQPIDEWNVSNVTDMQGMFRGAKSFNQPIGDWDVSKVTDMSYMFESAEKFDQPIGAWDVSKVKDMQGMFIDAALFNQPIGKWNVSKVTDMQGMFSGAVKFNNAESPDEQMNDWDVSRVKSMHGIFIDASSFSQNINNWNLRFVDSGGDDEKRMNNEDRHKLATTLFGGSYMFPYNFPSSLVVTFDPSSGCLSKLGSFISYPSYVICPDPDVKDITFPQSDKKITKNDTYFDIIDGDDKNLLDSLQEDKSLIAFNVNNHYHLVSKDNLLNVIMNDANNIKYECPQVNSFDGVIKETPYLSIKALGGGGGGVVSFFELWSAVTNKRHRAYEFVKTDHKLNSTASHDALYYNRRVSSAHCQAGQEDVEYEIRILSTDDDSSKTEAATKIQRTVRRHQSRKARSGSSRTPRPFESSSTDGSQRGANRGGTVKRHRQQQRLLKTRSRSRSHKRK